jgi:hypothetical protein
MIIKQKHIILKKKRNFFCLYLDKKLIFQQSFLKSNSKLVMNLMYTYLYILKVMMKFGLIAPLNRLFGYKKYDFI